MALAAVRAAHQALTGLGSPGDAPSATYISAVLDSGAVTVCWLGDSRAYWLSAGPGARSASAPMTRWPRRWSPAAYWVRRRPSASPQAHVITRWLGADVTDPQPHVVRFEPPGPGVVLVCSDGLWNYQPDAAALAALALPAARTDPLAGAAALAGFALDAGGMDNITAVLAPFPPSLFHEEPPHPKTEPVPRIED